MKESIKSSVTVRVLCIKSASKSYFRYTASTCIFWTSRLTINCVLFLHFKKPNLVKSCTYLQYNLCTTWPGPPPADRKCLSWEPMPCVALFIGWGGGGGQHFHTQKALIGSPRVVYGEITVNTTSINLNYVDAYSYIYVIQTRWS